MVFCSEYIRKRFVSSRLNVLARVDARVIGLYDVMRVGSLLDFNLVIRVIYERLKWVGMHAVFMMALKRGRMMAMTERGVFFRT